MLPLPEAGPAGPCRTALGQMGPVPAAKGHSWASRFSGLGEIRGRMVRCHGRRGGLKCLGFRRFGALGFGFFPELRVGVEASG